MLIIRAINYLGSSQLLFPPEAYHGQASAPQTEQDRQTEGPDCLTAESRALVSVAGLARRMVMVISGKIKKKTSFVE